MVIIVALPTYITFSLPENKKKMQRKQFTKSQQLNCCRAFDIVRIMLPGIQMFTIEIGISLYGIYIEGALFC